MEKEIEEIEEREIITEEDIDKNDPAYFENKEKELRQRKERLFKNNKVA